MTPISYKKLKRRKKNYDFNVCIYYLSSHSTASDKSTNHAHISHEPNIKFKFSFKYFVLLVKKFIYINDDLARGQCKIVNYNFI